MFCNKHFSGTFWVNGNIEFGFLYNLYCSVCLFFAFFFFYRMLTCSCHWMDKPDLKNMVY